MLTATIRRIVRDLANRTTVTGYREFCSELPTGRALVSYLPYPLLPPRRWRDKRLFSNRGLAQEIPRALNELGFVVDIVGSENSSWRPRRRYDIFIGHGAINFQAIATSLATPTLKIYFSTGLYWKEWNLREASRLYDFTLRTGRVLFPDRCIRNSEESANTLAHGIIHLGNSEAAKTYSKFGCVIGVNNAAFPVTWNGLEHKDFVKGRNHFLFLNGRGNIHKGLDRVLEAWRRLPADVHLHICQHIEPAFFNIYKRDLCERPNIHIYGFVTQRSKKFYDIAGRCDWVISATCAEGQPGSIIEAMAHGLIPIVPQAVNMNLGDWAVPLSDCTVEEITQVVNQCRSFDALRCRMMAEGSAREIRESYSPEEFREGFKKAVVEIGQRCEPRLAVAG